MYLNIGLPLKEFHGTRDTLYIKKNLEILSSCYFIYVIIFIIHEKTYNYRGVFEIPLKIHDGAFLPKS